MRSLYEQLKCSHYSVAEGKPGFLPAEGVFSVFGEADVYIDIAVQGNNCATGHQRGCLNSL